MVYLFFKDRNKAGKDFEKVSRAEKKLIEKQQAEAKKRKQKFKGQSGFVSDDGYVEYDGYVKSIETGDYITVFDVLVKYGTHNPEVIGWLTQLIPSDQLKHGDIWFGYREKGMGKKTEDTIFSKTLNSKQASAKKAKPDKDLREQSKRELEDEDINLTRALTNDDEKIVDSDTVLVVRAKSPKDLEKTIGELRQNYKDNGILGFMFLRKTSQILDTLLNVAINISADVRHNSDMQTVAASRLFLPSSGFADEYGVYCGTDVHSFISDNSSIIDFSGIRHAVIHTGGTKGKVSIGGIEGASLVSNYGTAIAHVVAQDNYMVNGSRTHFINLNKFDYQFEDSRVFDMKDYTINPLEVYGTKETVEMDANSNIDKVVEIIMLLLNSSKEEFRSVLTDTLVDWLIHRANGGSGMYTDDPKNEPTLAWRILATTNHQDYPTLTDFIPELQALLARESKKGDTAREKADMIYRSVRTASRRYPQVFKEKTNIPDSLSSTDRNIYYNLWSITNKAIKSATFLNVLAYVSHRANVGDVVVVTGLDSIKVDPKILKPYRDKLDSKGIGLITTFEERDDSEVNIDTMNDFINPLVTQDLVVLGGVTLNSLNSITKSWGRELPDIVKEDLTENIPSRFYVYRSRDFANAIIDAQMIL